MKKIAICLAAAMLAALAGCGQADKENPAPAAPESSSSAAAESASASEDASEDTSDVEGMENLDIQDAQLKAAYAAVRREFGDSWLAMPAPIEEMMLHEICYVDLEDVEEYAGETSVANISGDTFIAVKAKPGRAKAVAEALEKRRQDIINQFATYPVNFMDVKSQAARVITEGDYVFLALMGDLDVPDGQDATLEMAEAEVARAEQAIRSAFAG